MYIYILYIFFRYIFYKNVCFFNPSMAYEHKYDESGLTTSYLFLTGTLPIFLFFIYKIIRGDTTRKFPCFHKNCFCKSSTSSSTKHYWMITTLILGIVIAHLVRNIFCLKIKQNLAEGEFNPYSILGIGEDENLPFKIIKRRYRKLLRPLMRKTMVEKKNKLLIVEVEKKIVILNKAFDLIKDPLAYSEFIAQGVKTELFVALPTLFMKFPNLTFVFYIFLILLFSLGIMMFARYQYFIKNTRGKGGIEYGVFERFIEKIEDFNKGGDNALVMHELLYFMSYDIKQNILFVDCNKIIGIVEEKYKNPVFIPQEDCSDHEHCVDYEHSLVNNQSAKKNNHLQNDNNKNTLKTNDNNNTHLQNNNHLLQNNNNHLLQKKNNNYLKNTLCSLLSILYRIESVEDDQKILLQKECLAILRGYKEISLIKRSDLYFPIYCLERCFIQRIYDPKILLWELFPNLTDRIITPSHVGLESKISNCTNDTDELKGALNILSHIPQVSIKNLCAYSVDEKNVSMGDKMFHVNPDYNSYISFVLKRGKRSFGGENDNVQEISDSTHSPIPNLYNSYSIVYSINGVIQPTVINQRDTGEQIKFLLPDIQGKVEIEVYVLLSGYLGFDRKEKITVNFQRNLILPNWNYE